MECSLAALKVIALLARRPDITRAEFRSHYEERHVPLAGEVFEPWPGYVRNHIDRVYAAEEPDFDVLTMFWYRDQAQLDATVRLLNSPEGEVIRADEQRFMGKATNRFYQVRETYTDPAFRADCPWSTGFSDSTRDAFKLLALVPAAAATAWQAKRRTFGRSDGPRGMLAWVNNEVEQAPAEDYADITELWFMDQATAEAAVSDWIDTGVLFLAVTARQ